MNYIIPYSVKILNCFIDSLGEVRSGILHNDSLGICFNVQKRMELKGYQDEPYAYDIIREYSKDWEHYDPECDPDYPITDNREFDTWEGPNLELRRDLMKHLKFRAQRASTMAATQKHIREFKKAFIELRDSAADNGIVEDMSSGICRNVALILDRDHSKDIGSFACSAVAYYSTGWKHHQLNGVFSVFPVPHNKRQGYWEDDNLTMRISLLDHLINVCEEMELVLYGTE